MFTSAFYSFDLRFPFFLFLFFCFVLLIRSNSPARFSYLLSLDEGSVVF